VAEKHLLRLLKSISLAKTALSRPPLFLSG
jgi:hypothetical protein